MYACMSVDVFFLLSFGKPYDPSWTAPWNKNPQERIDMAVFPALQGGPHNHQPLGASIGSCSNTGFMGLQLRLASLVWSEIVVS